MDLVKEVLYGVSYLERAEEEEALPICWVCQEKNQIAAILCLNTSKHCSSPAQMALCTAHLTAPEISIDAVLSRPILRTFFKPPILFVDA